MTAPRGSRLRLAPLAIPPLLAIAVAAPLDGFAADSLRRWAGAWALIAVALALPGRLDAATRRIAPCMLGIYFVHILVRDVGRAGLDPSPGRILADGEVLLVAGLVWLASLAIVEGMRRTPLRRFAVVTER